MAKTLNKISAISILVTSMLGTGITFMPFAFRSMGYLGSWMFLTATSVGTFFSLMALCWIGSNHFLKDYTFTSFSKEISPFLYYFVNTSVFFNSFFSNVGFFRFLTNVLLKGIPVLRKMNDNEEICRKYLAFMLAPFLLFLSLRKTLFGLRFSSIIGFLSVLLLIVMMLIYSIVVDKDVYPGEIIPFNSNYKMGIPFFISSMVCQPNVIDVYNQLDDKSAFGVVTVCAVSSLMGLLCYGFTGFCGYIIFKNNINGHVMDIIGDPNSELNVFIRKNTFDKYNVFSKMAFYGVVFMLGSGFPVQIVPVADMFMKIIPRDLQTDRTKTYVILSLFTVCLALVLVERLHIIIIKRFSGAIFSTSTGLIYPFIYYLYYKRKFDALSLASVITGTSVFLSVCYIIYTLICDIINSDKSLSQQ